MSFYDELTQEKFSVTGVTQEDFEKKLQLARRTVELLLVSIDEDEKMLLAGTVTQEALRKSVAGLYISDDNTFTTESYMDTLPQEDTVKALEKVIEDKRGIVKKTIDGIMNMFSKLKDQWKANVGPVKEDKAKYIAAAERVKGKAAPDISPKTYDKIVTSDLKTVMAVGEADFGVPTEMANAFITVLNLTTDEEFVSMNKSAFEVNFFKEVPFKPSKKHVVLLNKHVDLPKGEKVLTGHISVGYGRCYYLNETDKPQYPNFAYIGLDVDNTTRDMKILDGDTLAKEIMEAYDILAKEYKYSKVDALMTNVDKLAESSGSAILASYTDIGTQLLLKLVVSNDFFDRLNYMSKWGWSIYDLSIAIGKYAVKLERLAKEYK